MRVFSLTAAALLCAAALSANAADRFDSLAESGALSAGVDVTHLVRASIDARLTEARANDRTDGGSLWLDVTGAKTRADKLTGDAGYKATVGVANLGADIQTGTHSFGVVYFYGKGDFDTVKTEHRDGDAAYYGVMIYGEERLGDAALSGKLGWTRMKNGVDTPTGHVYGMDGNLFTADVAANYRIRTPWLDIVPHAGVEATFINADNWSDGAAYGEPDNAALYEFPVGVTFTTARAVGAYSIRPTLDVTYAAASGDKTLKGKVNGTASETKYFEDGRVKVTAGLAATGEKGTLGLLYRYEAGEHDREYHSRTLQGKYVF